MLTERNVLDLSEIYEELDSITQEQQGEYLRHYSRFQGFGCNCKECFLGKAISYREANKALTKLLHDN